MGKLGVGIDLGTTNSCIAIFKNGKVELVEDEESSLIIPSMVTFTKDGVLVGNESKNAAHMYIKNTIFEVKRLIGQKFSDEDVQKDIKQFPYTVINDNDSPKIKVIRGDKEITYFPEEISAFLLEKLKAIGEAHAGQVIERVVVTIPARFNEFQRDATKKAALLAGFKTVNIVNEPTAAALAFNYDHPKAYERNVLVYDFGGGTFDVSIVNITNTLCKVKATLGDLHLGGTDIDFNLVKFIKEDFVNKFQEEIPNDEVETRRLKAICEKVKMRLSAERRKTEIEVSDLCGREYITTLSRLKFEQLNSDLFNKTMQLVEECLQQSKLEKDAIDEVVLVGGSSRIPKVQELLKYYFGADKINKSVNPDQCVAYGAAIHSIGDRIQVEDVIPLSLGVKILEDKYSVIIKCNTEIPTSKNKNFCTVAKDQENAEIVVYQGESSFVKHNFELGRFKLTGLRKAPASDVEVNVNFSMDGEGFLQVTASELGAVNNKSIKIDVERKGLSGEQLNAKIEEMKLQRADRRNREDFQLAKYELKNLCLKTQATLHTFRKEMQTKLNQECHKLLTWLESVSTEKIDNVKSGTKDLQRLINTAKK